MLFFFQYFIFISTMKNSIDLGEVLHFCRIQSGWTLFIPFIIAKHFPAHRQIKAYKYSASKEKNIFLASARKRQV